MKYLLMIYSSEEHFEGAPMEERMKIYEEYVQVSQDLRAAGKIIAAEPLQSVSTASTVRVRNGKTVVTDGPFAETREQLGGFYYIEAEDLDDALAIAARIPGARFGGIEVRPIELMEGDH